MIDHESINLRLEKLREYIKVLKDLRKCNLKQLKEDGILRGAVERYLQLSAECCIDIGEIVISGLNLRTPQTAREVIDILGEEKVIPARFAFHLAPVAGFRNILVHDYVKIDIEKVFQHLQEDIEDFNRFAKYVAQYLRKK